jgi:hypothetical protein
MYVAEISPRFRRDFAEISPRFRRSFRREWGSQCLQSYTVQTQAYLLEFTQ